jgi:hypothetical protein
MAQNTEQRNLADIRAVRTDPDLPKMTRMVEYIRQLNGDPTHYICGKFTVTERHPATGPSFEDCLRGMMV